MKRLIQLFFSIGVLLLATNVVVAGGMAGTLGELEGNVLVNQGRKYVPGHSGMQLKSGARILAVGKNSYAVVVHSDQCTTRVSSNALFVIGTVSPCKGGPSNVRKLQPEPIGWKKVALTSDASAADSPSVSTAAAAAPGDLGAWVPALWVGGIAATGAIAYGIHEAVSSDGDDQLVVPPPPLSPF